MKKISFVAVFLLFGIQAYNQQWNITNVDTGIKPSIALNQNNTVFIAYMNEKIGGFAKVAELINDEFQIATIDDGYFYGPLDIAIDNNGHPRVSYHDHNNENAVLMARSSTGWFQYVIPSSNHDGWDASVAIDEFNKSHVASVDPVIGLEYAVLNGNTWQIESPGTGGFMYRHSTSIALTSNNLPFIAYYKDNEDQLELAKKNGSSWEIGFVDNGGRFPSLVLDQDNNPIIAYFERHIGPIGLVKVATFNNGAWDREIIDTLNNVELTFSGARNVVSLQHDLEGNLHLSYGDKYKVFYAKEEEGNWQKELIIDVEGLGINLGQQTSLAIDNLGFAHITYFERTSNQDGGVIYYANNENLFMLLITCPPDQIYVCEAEIDTSLTGVPIILNNPGLEAIFSYTDNLKLAACGVFPDTLEREWMVTNEFGNFDKCTQKLFIEHYNRDDTTFPSLFDYTNECFFYPSVNQTGDVEGLCLNMSSRYEDELVNNGCEQNVTIRRRWYIEDWCQVIVDSLDQFIEFIGYDPINISLVSVFPDIGEENGSISFTTICGVPEYSYIWNTGSTESSLSNLTEGMYSVTISDALSCTRVFDFTVNGPNPVPVLQGNVRNFKDELIPDVEANINFLSGTPYPYYQCDSEFGDSYSLCFDDPDQVMGQMELCIDKTDVAAIGISGLDIVKAQRIILGLVDPCPFNVIAGDVNQDDKVSAADLVLMGRVILGLSSDFPNNYSWRFFLSNTEFPVGEDPLIILQNNECSIFNANDLPINNLDFTGIKLGDLECIDDPLFGSPSQESSVRTQSNSVIGMGPLTMTNGIFSFPVYIEGVNVLTVSQLALDFSNTASEIKGIHLNPYYSNSNLIFNYHIQDQILKILIIHPEGLELNTAEDLFTISGQYLKLDELNEIKLFEIESWSNEVRDSKDKAYSIDLRVNSLQNLTQSSSLLLYPNPFKEESVFEFTQDGDKQEGRIIIYNIKGEKVKTRNVTLTPGTQEFKLTKNDFPGAGTYILKLITPKEIFSAKLVKLN